MTKETANRVQTFRFDEKLLSRAVRKTKAKDKSHYIKRALLKQLIADKVISRKRAEQI